MFLQLRNIVDKRYREVANAILSISKIRPKPSGFGIGMSIVA
jgi:hypothetical protein